MNGQKDGIKVYGVKCLVIDEATLFTTWPAVEHPRDMAEVS